MTPFNFLWYSLTAIGDAFLLMILFSAFVGINKSMVEWSIRIYFMEKEKFLKRLGNISLPPDMLRNKELN